MVADFFLTVLNLIFFGILLTFLYFNMIAQQNFSKSNEIIIENPSSACSVNFKDLKSISTKDLIPCSSNNYEYIYNIPEDSLKFLVSTRPSDAGNFSTICNYYCVGNTSTTGKCLTVEGTIPVTYQNCIKLLEPSPGCTNSSNPIAIDYQLGNIFYAVRATPSNAC